MLSIREGNGTPLQYSCLENPMDEGAWLATVHGIMKCWTELTDFNFTFYFHALEKEMATLSSIFSWKIPGTEEPGGLLSIGLHRVGHDWSGLAAAAATYFNSSCFSGQNSLATVRVIIALKYLAAPCNTAPCMVLTFVHHCCQHVEHPLRLSKRWVSISWMTEWMQSVTLRCKSPIYK